MFNGLKLYTVHNQQGGRDALENPVFLREGFNWAAFLFTFIWALYQRLWSLALAIFVANIAVVSLVKYGLLNEFSGGVVQLALQIIVGFHANDFLRARMKSSGYIFQDIVSGDSLLRAKQRYFDRLAAEI